MTDFSKLIPIFVLIKAVEYNATEPSPVLGLAYIPSRPFFPESIDCKASESLSAIGRSLPSELLMVREEELGRLAKKGISYTFLPLENLIRKSYWESSSVEERERLSPGSVPLPAEIGSFDWERVYPGIPVGNVYEQ